MPTVAKGPLTSIPILTERVDADPTKIPTLTEIHAATESLSDEQYQRLAKEIGPHLEKLLRAKLTQNFEAQLGKALEEMQANLPHLIRATMESKHPL